MQSKNNTKQRNASIQGLRSFKDTLPKNVKKFANFSNFLAEICHICSREGDFLVDFEKC